MALRLSKCSSAQFHRPTESGGYPTRQPGDFQGASPYHTESDLRCYLAWCAERGLDPLAARRLHLALYIRRMQEVRRFKPSTVSRRFSVTAGFYRPCVIDGLLEHSAAEHVRRPAVPPESPTLGFTHLQPGALLTAARETASPHDFALVAMLGLLGLRIFEATVPALPTLVKNTATGCCACAAKHQDRPDPAAASRRPGHRPRHRHPGPRRDPAQQPRRTDGPPCRNPPPQTARRDSGSPDRQATSSYAQAYLRDNHAGTLAWRSGRPAGPRQRPSMVVTKVCLSI